MTRVTIIRDESSGMSLVEWLDKDDIQQRAKVKTVSILNRSGNQGEMKNPEQGVPYGVDFVHAFSPSVTSKDICRELRRRGLWTSTDMVKNPNLIMGAIQSAYGLDFARVIQLAQEYEKTTEE